MSVAPLLALIATLATPPSSRMVRVDGGAYRPLYGSAASMVRVAAFRIDVDPVTRAEFFGVRDKDGRRPATDVTWDDARAFCAARGKRLPTLAEWEYIAAASATSRDATGDGRFLEELVGMYSRRSSTPPSVDHGTLNAYGVRGLHDLVWEWVSDPNGRFVHVHGATHDASCAGAAQGATDPRNYAAFLRNAVRTGLERDTRLSTLGFRCAM